MAKTILLVDDSPVIRSVIRIYLERLPHTFEEAPDARAALDMLSRRPVDLIVADYNMPGMTGLSFLQHVRAHANARVRRLPVVLLTGEKSRDLPDRSKAAGATAFLRKPVSSTGLLALVRELLPIEDGKDDPITAVCR